MAVGFDRRDRPPANNGYPDAGVAEKRGEVVVRPLQPLCFGAVSAAGLVVVGIAVQRRVGRDVVLEQRGEVLAPSLGVEEEGVGLEPEALEGAVGWCENRAADQLDVVDVLDKVCLFVRQQKRRELAREERDQPAGRRWRDQDVVDSVDEAVGGLLNIEGRQSANKLVTTMRRLETVRYGQCSQQPPCCRS